MIITLYALENTKAKMCVKRASFTDNDTAEIVRAAWSAAGFIVTEDRE